MFIRERWQERFNDTVEYVSLELIDINAAVIRYRY